MTPLESKSARDSRGINTYERGLLYATLLLIASNTSLSNTKPGKDNPYYEAIKLSFERGKYVEEVKGEENQDPMVDPAIIIEAHLPYNGEAALKAGGNYFEYIESFNNIDPNPLRISVEPVPNPFDVIAVEPMWVDTLEKYLAWIASLIEDQTYYYEDYERTASTSFATDSKGKTFVKIDARLPYDFSTFVKKRNFLAALNDYGIER